MYRGTVQYSIALLLEEIGRLRGCANKRNSKMREYYGSGWVGPGLTRNFFVSYYDLSVLSKSVIVSTKRIRIGVGGWGELYPSFFWIFGIFLTLQSPLLYLREAA